MATLRQQERRPRSDGLRSRRAILDAAIDLATLEGLDGLSIGRLADQVGISKSGLHAHFGSKEALQLATIDEAAKRYERDVVRPGLAEPDPVARLVALCGNFLTYIEDDVFPGGCFFASVNAEFDTRPGPVRDVLIELQTAWLQELTKQYADAQTAGLLVDPGEPEQSAFEINAYLHLANDLYVLYRDPVYIERGRRAIAAYLERHRPAV
ncbi:TetR/AcrR family transcriptional regulator [Actinoplanes solisilvae]|uniref:TetR/AcrR family transcriptional regulator n=1 Tax=Actinoplanes solisilvae TaxID=2486853 RepID=UPI00196B2EEA|nr:TetR/AcrR family transcriptional regulator [Actinoplanes solisilvae]